jgi:PAS domain S-box-containing protein
MHATHLGVALSETSSSWTSPLLDLLFEEPGMGRCLVAPDGSILRANGEWLRSAGLTLDDALGADIIDLFPETRDMALAMHARVRAGHRVEVPLHAQRGGGREAWWQGSIAPVPMEGGTGLLIAAREVAPEQRGPEEAGRAEHRAFVDAVESLQDGFLAFDRDWRFTYVNRRAASNVGVEPRDLIGRNLWELFPSLIGTEQEAAHRRVMARRVPESIEVKGTLTDRWYRIGLSPTAQGLSVVWTDITERKQAEEALRASEADLRAILNAATESIWLFSADGVALAVNETGLARWGGPPETIIGKPIHEFMPDELGRSRLARLEEAARTGRAVEFEDSRAGIHFEHTFYPVSDASGGIDRIAIFSRDVTDRRRNEVALRRYELLASLSRDIVLFMRRDDGRILEANSAALAAYGFSREELLSLSIGDLRAPDTVPLTEGQMAIADERGILFETVHRRKDGSTFEAEVSSRGATVDGARTLISVVRDVTDRKRAERALRESEEKYAAIHEHAPFAIALTKLSDGTLVEVNDAWVRMFGYTREETVGRKAADLALVGDPASRSRLDEAMREGGSAREWEAAYSTRSGEHRIFSAVVNVVEIGGQRFLLLNAHDITERKRADEELRRSDRQKTDFLAVLSHELRNPLAPIRNSIYLLERAAPDSEPAARARGVLRRQTEHLTRLVDDLLDITRISRGKITLQRTVIDLREIVHRTTDDLLSVFHRSEVELRVEHAAGPVWVDADATRLSQVVGNLLHNSVKFTPRHGIVVVGIATVGGRAEIYVRDTGIGIEPDQVERMFEPFAQADHGLARTNGGLGLGLALVKGFVELHGGSVRARSDGLGRGAEFVVVIPTCEPRADESGAPRARPRAAGRLVLIIEDNVDAGQSLADILRLKGHRTSLARDGRSGIELARELRPDVVVCDIGLPDLDGYEVARALRGDDSLRSVRLIALSGYAQAEDLQRAREAGFDVHIAKPADIDKLTAAIAGK